MLRFFESPGALVFCNTRNAVRHLQATLSERGFSVVALSGELTQNERTQALQSLRDGRARVCVATDVAARGIDLPNLDLVIHADLPNDAGGDAASLRPHRPCRPQGRQRPAGAAGAQAARGTAAQSRRHRRRLGHRADVEEIRKLDQERMLKDTLFAEETTPEDLALAQAMLAERSPEDIAAALARLYRARLPSPEDILDPGQGAGRSRDDRRPRKRRPATARRRSRGRAALKARQIIAASRGMAEGSVWFRAAIGRRKNAEARWLLPMICRRGGIDKHDIGAIRIMDTTTEFEISRDAPRNPSPP